MAEDMVSINQVVDIVKELSRGGLKGFGGGGGLVSDCDSRCGCVGQNCDCYNQVHSVFDRMSWVEFQRSRESRMNDLKLQLTALEQETAAIKQMMK